MAGYPADLHGAVAARIAGADHQHPLAGKGRIGFVAVGMQILASEGAWNIRPAGYRVVAVGGEQVVEMVLLPILQSNGPLLFCCLLHLSYWRIEADVFFQPEMAGVVLKIGQHLGMGGIIRIVIRHGEIQKFRHRPGGDDVGGLANAGMRFARRENPVAAHLIVLLKANDVLHAGLYEVFDRGQARATGANDAYGGGGCGVFHGYIVKFLSAGLRALSLSGHPHIHAYFL